ncbi:hypothetical protein NMY3_01225 [Candidatus Nitrosocosmicus oleophilus]|uniref:Uncharacterized protein n=1 Tax=Candidatus Nitrosocosmicus oleophilus TaxID=1353260 RepID=A0A654LX85_9ARCH|nr:hypothetical protein [Candidatus Nitrosocosmicus oleophilus]ALI35430.1 hypothetical protein NMY3_01225 [Candidatus Nitrosocosmicus oleophilus]
MSSKPLEISEIEDAVEKEIPGSRQNYVYEVEKRLYHKSAYTPSTLVFREGDFLNTKSDQFELVPLKFRDKAFEIYNDYFKCESSYDLKYDPIEKENTNNQKIKGIKIYDQQNNYLRIEINFTLLNEKGKLEEGLVKFFQKSRFSDFENELYLHTGREKGGFVVRNFSIVPNYFYLDYVDMVFHQDGEKKYVLNLKGLLHLFLLSGNKLEIFEIDKILSNVSEMDEYMNLRDEIDSAYGSITGIKYKYGNTGDIQKIFSSSVSPKIKTRFPFLSFYNLYKEYIASEDESFVKDFLFGVAVDFEPQLRIMSITKLKYEVTKRYLERIRKYFYSFHKQRLLHTNLSSNTFQAITKLQNEIGIYVEEMKRSDYEWEKLERRWYEEQHVNIEFERKLNTLTDLHANVISLKEILPVNRYNRVIPTRFQEKIIKRFCEYYREEEDSYSFINHYVLVKNSLLKEIAQSSSQNNYDYVLQSELHKNGIPLDCKKDIQNWIKNYLESLEQ